jgi:ubiquinone/menaquinone biosynthesis C-methylase UbiE
MPFGYVPDFQNSRALVPRLKDLYLRVLGMPFYQRRAEARTVSPLLADVNGERILDIGCGDGLFAIELAKKGAVVDEIDLCEEALERGERRIRKLCLDHQVGFIKCDASKMPFSSDSHHKAIANCVLEHIPQDVEVLQEANRVLKKGGLLVITVPLDLQTHQRISGRLVKVLIHLPQRIKSRLCSQVLIGSHSLEQFAMLSIIHYNHARFGYSTSEIEDKLNRAGFEIVAQVRYLKAFGAIGVDLMEGLAAFQAERGGEFGYRAKHNWLYGFCFPFFYTLSFLDALLPPNSPALGIAISARKK